MQSLRGGIPMANRDIEEKIVGARTLAAHRLLLAEMPRLGLTPSHNSGHVRAVRLHDLYDRYVFSWIPNQQHLLFYIRLPALNAAPSLKASAERELPGVSVNNAGEVTARIEGTEDAQLALRWLATVLPLPE